MPSPDDTTELLLSWNAGNPAALDRLMPLVYSELRAIAQRHLGGMDRTLQATAVVHEAYLKLVDQRRATFHNRAHFLAIAAQLIRRIVIDDARARGAQKRGANQRVELLDEPLAPQPPEQLVELDAALDTLEQKHPGKGKLVELRYFGGLTIEETAEVLGISPATVKRDWITAKAWLARSMGASA